MIVTAVLAIDKTMIEDDPYGDIFGMGQISRDASSRVMEQAPPQAARDLGVGHFVEVGSE